MGWRGLETHGEATDMNLYFFRLINKFYLQPRLVLIYTGRNVLKKDDFAPLFGVRVWSSGLGVVIIYTVVLCEHMFNVRQNSCESMVIRNSTSASVTFLKAMCTNII